MLVAYLNYRQSIAEINGAFGKVEEAERQKSEAERQRRLAREAALRQEVESEEGEPGSEQVAEPVTAAEPAPPGKNGSKRVYRVDNNQRHKPMTLDEAVLEMEKDHDYLVYRDAGNDRLSVLMRRRDGHFDLIEC